MAHGIFFLLMHRKVESPTSRLVLDHATDPDEAFDAQMQVWKWRLGLHFGALSIAQHNLALRTMPTGLLLVRENVRFSLVCLLRFRTDFHFVRTSI